VHFSGVFMAPEGYLKQKEMHYDKF